jgi:two-component system OmpR family response regulator
MAYLLLVEDDDLLRDSLSELLTQAGHRVETAVDGIFAQTQLQSNNYDAVLLDLGLPRLDGMGLLQWIRQRFEGLPVMILTARVSVDDRVEGLMAGADDYLSKPFEIAEFMARLSALLRRARLPAIDLSEETASPTSPPTRLRIDPHMPRAWVQDKAVELTQREWELLQLLYTHLNQVVSREAVTVAWQSESGETLVSNALEVYIHRLRRKLQDSGLGIRNVRGLGYMMEKL